MPNIKYDSIDDLIQKEYLNIWSFSIILLLVLKVKETYFFIINKTTTVRIAIPIIAKVTILMIKN